MVTVRGFTPEGQCVLREAGEYDVSWAWERQREMFKQPMVAGVLIVDEGEGYYFTPRGKGWPSGYAMPGEYDLASAAFEAFCR